MRLLATGNFVRATRSARFTTAPRSLIRPVPSLGTRWTSNQATAKQDEPFPEHSVDVDLENPFKNAPAHFTAHTSQSTGDGGPREEFRRYIQDGKKNNNQFRAQGTMSGAKISGRAYVFDETSNISPSILNLVDRKLYDSPDHPICITRKLIESAFPDPLFIHHTVENPVVTTHNNFDVLGFPKDHPGRSRTDTYYVDASHVLRTHTSAHQHAAFAQMTRIPEKGYTICADVYRRDSIDRSHFPVFHQMEGARLWDMQGDGRRTKGVYEMLQVRIENIKAAIQELPKHDLKISDEAGDFNNETNPPQLEHDELEVRLLAQHLKRSLELLVNTVFTAAKTAGVGSDKERNEPMQVRWIEAYFPFTSPSWELEVFWEGEWLELLGCGIVQQPLLDNAGMRRNVGWAWGIGVERLAMLLFGIPDIRLFWSTDPRFLSQFQEGKVTKFMPFSKYPACYKDVAFWVDSAPASASPIGAQSSSGVAAAAGGDATKASPAETLPSAFHENDMMEIVRNVAGSVAEDVQLVDEFVHPKTGRKSLCYRINYRSLERTLTNEEVNEMHNRVTGQLKSNLGLELR